MLFYQTVDSGTLELLRKLQGIKAFSQLRLVGGTALALQIGHRKSIDIDLFDGSPFLVLKSLSYFDDAEKDPMPFMLSKITWPKNDPSGKAPRDDRMIATDSPPVESAHD